MAWYTFQELTLEMTHAGQGCREDVARLLQELSWVCTAPTGQPPTLRLAVHQHTGTLRVPSKARLVFQADALCGFELGDVFYLTDGASLLHLQALQGQGTAQLAPTFGAQPRVVQRTFWVLGLLKLLRPLGFYSLHAAGVVPAHGQGVLIIGPSGSGKSTLALGLLRQGWRYLSDDAVFLRLHPEGVVAVACRKHMYVDAGPAAMYAEIPFGEAVLDASGRYKRRVHLAEAYPGQQVAAYRPRVLLFAVPAAHSTLCPLDPLRALKYLLDQSVPQLFDRQTMAQHLEVLKRLMQQAASYELHAGLDLYQQPGTLVRLLAEAEGAERWPVLSSS
jgi:hypothetical protein